MAEVTAKDADPLDKKSFSLFSSIALPHSHSLAHNAINPCIDIVALHRTAPRPPRPTLPISAILAARREKAKAEATRQEVKDAGWTLKDEDAEQDEEEIEERDLERVVVSVWRLHTKDDEGKQAMLWDKMLPGNGLAGLVWSVDGFCLSVIVNVTIVDYSTSTEPLARHYKLYHLSVHDGAVLHCQYLPVQAALFSHSSTTTQLPLTPTWLLNSKPWPSLNPSSSLAVINSIAYPNPIRPWTVAKATGAGGQLPSLPSMSGLPGASSVTATLDKRVEKLVRRVCGDLPVILGDGTGEPALEDVSGKLQGRMDPHVLHIPEVGISLLGGTYMLGSMACKHPGFTTDSVPLIASSTTANTASPFIVPPSTSTPSLTRFDQVLLPESTPTDRVLRLTHCGDRMRRYLKVAVQGLEVCGRIWREGIEEEHRGWLERLEKCSQDNGSNLQGAQADLTRLLLAGRSGDAISQFIGQVLTNNGLDKWSAMYDASMSEMRRVLTTTIFPSCERLLVILEELSGWLMHGQEVTGCNGDALAALREAMRWTSHLATKAMELDRVAQEECRRFREFVKFMRYEISRNTITQGDEDVEVPSTHDVLLVCDYLDTAFLESHIPRYLSTLDQIEMIQYDRPSLPTRRSDGNTKSLLARNLVKLKRSITDPAAKIDGATDTHDPTPAMLSPMLRRAGQLATSPGVGDSMDFQDEHPSGRDEASGQDAIADESKQDMSADRGRPATSRRKTLHTSRLLWPMITEVAKGLRELLKPDGPLQWVDRESDPAVRMDAATSTEWYQPLPSSDDVTAISEIYPDRGTRFAAWTTRNEPSAFRIIRLERTQDDGVLTSSAHLEARDMEILDVRLFDLTELLVLVRNTVTGQLYLCAIEYQVDQAMHASGSILKGVPLTRALQVVSPAFLPIHWLGLKPRLPTSQGAAVPPAPLELSRSRFIAEAGSGSGNLADPPRLAANGRTGRRLACVLSARGTHLDVFDTNLDEVDDDDLDLSVDAEME